MMFTPLIFVRNGYAQTLVLISLALLIKWEVLLRLHPERFSENTNACLACAQCQEKLCHHKKQLQRFIKRNAARLHTEGNFLFKGDRNAQ